MLFLAFTPLEKAYLLEEKMGEMGWLGSPKFRLVSGTWQKHTQNQLLKLNRLTKRMTKWYISIKWRVYLLVGIPQPTYRRMPCWIIWWAPRLRWRRVAMWRWPSRIYLVWMIWRRVSHNGLLWIVVSWCWMVSSLRPFSATFLGQNMSPL